MNRIAIWLALLAAVACVAGCRTQRVTTETTTKVLIEAPVVGTDQEMK